MAFDAEEQSRDFDELLDSIENLNSKKKKLWREIYTNAIIDRNNSYEAFVTLRTIMSDKSTEHAVHGKTLSIYIEKMSRANDQLIKLAEMVAHAEEKAGPSKRMSPDDIYNEINAS